MPAERRTESRAGATALCIQFARAPAAGRVKTRMQPALTAAEACELHVQLLCWTCRRLGAVPGFPLELWVSGTLAPELRQQCHSHGAVAVRRQQGADLGTRMYHALAHGLGRAPRVILVGSDCPDLGPVQLRQAAAALEHADIVLGPALDGGYVLIGARRIAPAVFEGCEWGSAGVLDATLANIRTLGWRCETLAPLRDIDRPADLSHWRRVSRRPA